MLGENIKNYRQHKGYTQEEIASRLHVTRQTISKWEKNHSVPDADLLVKLAEVLEVETSQLLGNESSVKEKDAYAEQLAHIAEQMAIRNRISKRIWKTIGIIAAVVGGAALIIWILQFVAFYVYSFEPESNSESYEETIIIEE